MKLPFHVVIPARLGSTRLPRKPLLLIAGKPMVVRVAEQAAKSGAQQIWIATDHQAILAAVQEHGFKACLTKTSHLSGTDRIAEVAEQQKWPDDTIVVNVQGDEPLIPHQLIKDVAQHLHDNPQCVMSTACHPFHDVDSMRNPNMVKVVLDKQDNALYFSRAPIPYPRDTFSLSSPEGEDTSSPALAGVKAEVNVDKVAAHRHIGIYAYRAGFLRAFHQLVPSPLEKIEALEQLRVLWHGYKIGVFISAAAMPSGVDTEQDLITVRKIFE